MVEPTHLKNMLVKMGSSSPSFGVKIPKIFELPPPRRSYPLISPENNRIVAVKARFRKFLWSGSF